jgi:hypothetical protein
MNVSALVAPRSFVLLAGLLAACSSPSVSPARPVEPAVAPEPAIAAPAPSEPAEVPALLRVSVTREERSRDSSTRVRRYALGEGRLVSRSETIRGRSAPPHEVTAELSAEEVEALLELARREGLAADEAAADPPLTEPGVRTRYDVELDGHRWSAVVWELMDGPAAPAPDLRVLAVRRVLDALEAHL